MEGRIDAHFYKSEFFELDKKIKNGQFECKRFGSLIKYISSGATPLKSESNKFYTDDKINGIPLLRVQNITEEGLMLDDVIFINSGTHTKDLKRSQVFEGDLLVTITGRIASSAVAPENFEGNINQHSVMVRTNDLVLNKYLAIYFNSHLGQKFAIRVTTGGTRPALDYTALKSLLIPVPPIETQQKVVAIFESAYQSKKAKEAEAKRLLDSIDAYLLEKLGIILPEKTATKKTFFVNFAQIQGNRFDPFYHKTEFEDKIKSIEKGTYPTMPTKKLLKAIKKGIEVGSNAYTDLGVPFIRVSDINNFGLDYENADKKISQNLYETLKNDYQPDINEILYSKDGTIGFCCVLDKVENCVTSGGILRLQPNNEIVNTLYLCYILSLNLFKGLAERISIGAVIKHLTMEEWLKIQIPLPPLSVQEEIATHITGIRAAAKQLQAGAKTELETAKIAVEKMILGE